MSTSEEDSDSDDYDVQEGLDDEWGNVGDSLDDLGGDVGVKKSNKDAASIDSSDDDFGGSRNKRDHSQRQTPTGLTLIVN